MFARWRAAGLILPSLLTLALLPLLIGLGNWQWHRKAWKEDLIAKIDARRTAEPVSYPAALAKYVKDGDVEYLHVRVTGTFDYSHERHLYAPAAETQGWNVYTPLKPGGEGGSAFTSITGWSEVTETGSMRGCERKPKPIAPVWMCSRWFAASSLMVLGALA